jgi:hypothetical protein
MGSVGQGNLRCVGIFVGVARMAATYFGPVLVVRF